MDWYLVFGKHEEKLRLQQTQSGKVVKALENKPYLQWYLQEIMQSFLSLNHRRLASMTALHFTPESIYTHGLIQGFGPDIEFYYRCCLALDDLYMDKYAEREKARAQDKKNKAAQAPRRRS